MRPTKPEYASLTADGQITIPAEIRKHMKLRVGAKISIQRDGQILVLPPITSEFIDSLCGSTKGLGKLRDRIHRDDEDSKRYERTTFPRYQPVRPSPARRVDFQA
jgi:AbrB family looped-hinge helix DNA binding protein